MKSRITALLAVGAVGALALAGCGADTSDGNSGSGNGGGGSEGGGEINVLMVGNPQMKDIESLAQEHFTDETGIKVNFTILPENELRDKVAQDVATQAGQYDVVTIGAYEGSVWTANDWLYNLQDMAEEDADFDVDDILQAMKGVLSKDGDLYAIPFYGESAFTMYRADIFEELGLTMPAEPTWADIEQLASQIDGKVEGVNPICLRGLPGWGENMAVVGAMINSFGGTWFDADWNAQMNSAGTAEAIEFYVNLVTKYGEAGASEAGFTECLNNFTQGKSAMWYDATSAANTVESPDNSTVVGKVGYADAPREEARAAWVWSWAWAIPKTTKNLDDAWKYVAWASSKDYEKTAGEEIGWTRVPDGKRASTFDIPEYKEASAAYSAQMQAALNQSNPADCGVQARPAPGCQYMAFPEFADLGTKVGQELSAAIAGQKSAAEAIDACQALAEQVSAEKK
ncbi:MAG: sugar ABC transporter substrate-binding protein [Bifidobacteriaceae bacterium]|jgi:sorbitol/mannitol transport system substrate-binding protein|nr:sugar ABC transporter substrate-binding protein [Bifidobacteriaceae bacterium]